MKSGKGACKSHGFTRKNNAQQVWYIRQYSDARLCPRRWASLPHTLGIIAQGMGHAYPRTWSCVPMYVGMSTRVRGYEYPCTWAG